MRRTVLPALAALWVAVSTAACGVDSNSICHPVNNPCIAPLVCSGGACLTRCDVDISVCPANIGCDKATGLCAPYCSFGNCNSPALCAAGNICVKP